MVASDARRAMSAAWVRLGRGRVRARVRVRVRVRVRITLEP